MTPELRHPAPSFEVPDEPDRRRRPNPMSVNHDHLLAILNTEIARRSKPAIDSPLRILDAGCGGGQLLAFLTTSLTIAFPGRDVELYGFDVSDHGAQLNDGFLSNAVTTLTARFPDQPWEQRVVSISEHDTWPFPDGHFDAVVSNQVLEHVRDADFFLGEIARTLRPGGFSVHLFPLRNALVEWHSLLPLAHWPEDHDRRQALVRLASKLGFGPYRKLPRDQRNLLDFTDQISDYILHFTTYRRPRELASLAKTHRLRFSFRYTREYYAAKMRRILKTAPRTRYSSVRSTVADALAFVVLKYVASVTFFLEKQQTYKGLGLKS